MLYSAVLVSHWLKLYYTIEINFVEGPVRTINLLI